MCQTLGTQMPVSGGFWFYGDDRYQTDKPTASFAQSPVEHSRIKRCTRPHRAAHPECAMPLAWALKLCGRPSLLLGYRALLSTPRPSHGPGCSDTKHPSLQGE